MTLNAWGGAIGAPVATYVAEADADIVCLQEVTRSPDGVSEWLTYRDGDHVLKQRSSLFDEVSAALPAHDGFFAPAARGALFDGQDRPVASLWGLATFVRRAFPVIAERQGFIHGAFSGNGWGDHPRARNAQGLRVFDPTRGRAVTVVNLHGLRDPAGKGDTPMRAAQTDRLVKLISGLASPGDERIVCGDFNILPTSATFTRLGEIGLTDLVVSRGHSDTRTSHYRKTPRFADYMLVSENVAVEAFEVVEQPEVSDHRPLILTTR